MTEPKIGPCWICGAQATGNGLTLENSVCARCRDEATRPYDEAWQALARYLHAHWRQIVARGSFDLSKVFGNDVASQALKVHLYFVKVLGCKLKDGDIDIDLQPFSAALSRRAAHPEVFLMVANALVAPGSFLSYQSDVSVLRSGSEVQSALWMNLLHPVAIKVCYIKQSAPLRAPEGFPWHPTRQRKVVKISPYKGDTEPLVARRDLRIL